MFAAPAAARSRVTNRAIPAGSIVPQGLGNAVAMGPAGSVLSAGATFPTFQSHGIALLVKHGGAGKKLWTQRISATGGGAVNYGVAHSGGRIFTTGYTDGAMPGEGNTNAGSYDAFLTASDENGKLLWARQLGSSAFDWATTIAADASGNAYIAGWTQGTLPGAPNPIESTSETFLAKYDVAGNRLWTRQLTGVEAQGVGVDVMPTGDIVLAARSHSDTLLLRFAPDGTLEATVPIAGAMVDGSGYDPIAHDANSNVYITGITTAHFAAEDGHGNGFLIKVDPAGTVLAAHRFGCVGAQVHSLGVAVTPAGTAYVTGYAPAQMRRAPEGFAGELDAFLIKYDAAGHLRWVHEYGTVHTEDGFAVAVGPAGNPVIVGNSDAYTDWSMLTLAYDRHGALRWQAHDGGPTP